MNRSHRSGRPRASSRVSRSLRSARYVRRAAFERLEDRRVLSPILGPFTTQIGAIGPAPLIAPASGKAAVAVALPFPAAIMGPIAPTTTHVKAVNSTGGGKVNVAVATASTQSVTPPAERSAVSDIILGNQEQLVFTTQPTDTTAGSVITPPVQVSIEDSNGNVVTTDNSTVVISLVTNFWNDGTLSGTLSVAAVNGVATFSDLSIDQPGEYSLAVQDSSLANYSMQTSNWFNITPLPAKLVFTTEPSNTTAGTAISPAVQVSVEDAAGDVATGDNSNVTISLGSLGGDGSLSGTLTEPAVDGVATFNDLSVDKASLGYTLNATDGSLTGATSDSFNVTPGAPSHVVFVAQSGEASAGASMGPWVVAVEDSAGNLVTSDNSEVTIAIGANPGGGTLLGTQTVAATGGVAVFDDLSIDDAGAAYTLTAADGSLAGATSVPFDVAPASTGSPAVALDWSGWGSPLVLTQAVGGQTPAVSISESSSGADQLRIDLGAGNDFAAGSAAAPGLFYENAGSPATSQYATIDISSPQSVSALVVALPGGQISLGPIQDLDTGLGGIVADAGKIEVAGINLISAGGNVDLRASGDLTVDANASILTGTGTIALEADVNADGSGDDGLGTLSIAAGAVVDSTNASADAITLRGAQVNIDTSSDPALVGAQHSVETAPSATLTGITWGGTLAVDASGDLFVADGSGNVIEFLPGTTTPAATLTGLSDPFALAVAGDNLFVANAGNDTVSEFAPGATTPTTTFSGLSGDISALALDASDDLFVSSGNVVSEFAAGATSPTATLSGLDDPAALALDSHGNLFVANEAYPGSVSEFAPGATTPTATLTGVDFPAALAFDSDGNLFVGNDGYPNGSVSEFAPGATVPTATLTGTGGANALAIDASGNVYVCNASVYSNSVSVFARGATTPTATLSGVNYASGLVFDAAGNLYVQDGSWPWSVLKFSPGGSLPTAGGVVIRSSLEDQPISLGGAAANDAGGVDLTSAELAQIYTTADGTVTIGDSAQTGDITFTTAAPATTAGTSIVVLQAPTGPGKIVLDDGGGAATALNSNGGSITLSAGTGGILAASPNNSAAEIAAIGPVINLNPGPSVTLDTTGPIGSAANRIQFADNPNTGQDVFIGQPDSTNEPSCVFLDGLGSLTLGDIYGGTVHATIDVTARTDLNVADGAVIDSGTSPLSLGADLNPDGTGDDGTGTLSIGSAAVVVSADPAADAITLRGADINIDASDNPAVIGARACRSPPPRSPA